MRTLHSSIPLILYTLILRAAGTIIGDGISSFITNWDKMTATVSKAMAFYHCCPL